MPSAQGIIRSAGGGRFVAIFQIDGIAYNFAGTLVPSGFEFTSSNAKLSYDDVEALHGNRPFAGNLGPTTVVLQLANGPIITGTLDAPVVPAVVVTGSGTWVVSL